MYKRLLVLLFTLLLAIGCSSNVKVKRAPEINYKPVEMYTVDLSDIPKIGALNPVKLDKNFKKTNINEDVVYLAFSPSEMSKVKAIIHKGKALKSIIKQQEKLVNIHINNENSLKEFVALERMKSNEYRGLWVDSENAYRQEKRDRKIDSIMSRGTMIIMILQTIAVAVILL